jgi:mannose-1-phosphate guanylyltransferase/mannose-6-phosphate isomerase
MHMIVVIIAGGSGTRLWPLSTSDYPKQLLKLTNEQSMVQNTYQRAKYIAKDIYVVPDISHAHHIKAQLPELDDDHFVVEPGRRGTASCIVAALVHISKRHGSDEPIAFIHADHHIRDNQGFARSFQTAAEVSSIKKEITLIGIEPTFPSTGFGYIKRDGELSEYRGVYHIEMFKEKPDYETAKKFMASGDYLWNCGYFVGSVNTFLSEMTAYAPDRKKDFDDLVLIDDPNSKEYTERYLACENDAIDYALNEKSKSLLVVPANFDWMDLGSFKDLHDANERDEYGNHLNGENIYVAELENAYIRNEEADKPIAIIGLDNIVVVNTKDGILVARKDLSQKVGDIAKKIQAKS